MGVCVFLSGVWGVLKEKQEKSLPFKKKNWYTTGFEFKRSFSCLSRTLGEAIMERAVVQIALFGLLLALGTTLPNKVSLKDRAPLCKEIECITFL